MNDDQRRILLFSLRRQFLNGLVIIGSVLLCALLSLTRLSGMELVGIGPNWLLIWVVVWSLRRSAWQGIVAGVALGWIQDSMTSLHPSHVLSLGLVGFLSSRLAKPRHFSANFIAIALITFVMTVLAEAVTAIQYVFQDLRSPEVIWRDYQWIALSSALLSSLWSPVLAYPLNCWWESSKAFKP